MKAVVGRRHALFGMGVAALVAFGIVRTQHQTLQNLEMLYLWETGTQSRYGAYASTAESEGYPGAARLFRAAIESETVHAANYQELLAGMGVLRPSKGHYDGGSQGTDANVEEALNQEIRERRDVLPAMIETARYEHELASLQAMRYALASEDQHLALFQQAPGHLRDLDSAAQYLVRPVCGATFAGEAPDYCPTCGTPGKSFKTVR